MLSLHRIDDSAVAVKLYFVNWRSFAGSCERLSIDVNKKLTELTHLQRTDGGRRLERRTLLDPVSLWDADEEFTSFVVDRETFPNFDGKDPGHPSIDSGPDAMRLPVGAVEVGSSGGLDLHAATWTAPESYQIQPDARRFENWENYVAGKIGLGVAVDYALALDLDAIAERVRNLADGLRENMTALPGVTVNDLGARKCGIVSFSVNGVTPDAVVAAMAANGINLSASSARSTQQDMSRRGIAVMNRLGLHYYNTEDELQRFLEVLRGLRA
jgi:hypothetical protein